MLETVVGGFVNKQRWLDGVGDAMEKIAAALFDQAGAASQAVEDVLHGTGAGHPVHPLLTDIPIGAWTTTLALDLAGNEEGADLALKVGLAGAIAAALAGLADWRYTKGTMRRTGVAHALLNVTGTTLYALSAARRRTANRSGAQTLSTLGYLCIAGGGYLGGDLSYQLGAMVNRNAWVTGESPFKPVMALDDLEQGAPTRAEVDGTSVVLVRQGETVHCLAESCAHLGAPLSEGEVVDDTIKCPWHGSRFRLEDGRVVEGPAVYNQPCFAVRVRDGMIEAQLAGDAGEREPWYRVRGQTPAS